MQDQGWHIDLLEIIGEVLSENRSEKQSIRYADANFARCRPEVLTALETAYAVRMKEIG